MIYYKVKPHADNMRKGIRFVYDTLVGNELYTAREIEKAQLAGRIDDEFIRNHLEKIEQSKQKTVFVFGARFACS